MAGWMGKGSWEPDTARDRQDGWMFQNPDWVAITGLAQSGNVHKVYFNGFHGDYSGSFNPSIAMAQTSIYHGASYQFYAMFGVWKDCNRDNYIGSSEQGQWEYRAELLLDRTICKPQSIPVTVPSGKPPLDWFPVHNDGVWVHEMIPIGWFPYSTNLLTGETSWYDINDNSSRAWIDYGNVANLQPPWGNCWIGSAPRGSTHSTGGLLEYLDCFTGGKIVDNIHTIAQATNADNLGFGRVSFDDHPRDEHNSESILNIKSPWGDAEDQSHATMWDCSQRVVSQDVENPAQADPSQKHVAWVNLSTPLVPSGVNNAGTPAGTFNESAMGVGDCDRTKRSSGASVSQAPYLYEDDVLQGYAKIQPDGTLGPNGDTRPDVPFATVTGKSAPAAPDLGTRLTSGALFWSDITTSHLAEPNFFNSKFELDTAWYNTFYGYVSPVAIAKYGLSMPKGGAMGVYGAEACGTKISGIYNGWDCDSKHWWVDANGNDIETKSTRLAASPGIPVSARPGTPYNLRDVDCYDHSAQAIRQTGVGLDIVTGTRCAR